MNFLKKAISDTNEDSDNKKSSSSDLFGSAKVLSDAATSAFQHETDKIDKAKVADAGGDVLGAVSDYAKLEKTSVGQYVDKAEDYLHGYGKPSQPPTTATTTTTTTTTATATAAAAVPAKQTDGAHSEGGDKAEGGAGGYMKMAEGLFKH
ncbi:hypothetical protein J5N97_008459 [Dioscorea zingiberensis]|uniref:Uncharacterized protein n=1 Tax=Dioscorea zingiberensis TaxID=325984 RepID=A0A9D5CWJ3_9LILI|nr:hypothetical protein J5N97_008459 [Dioscorea zingiberensis]